ncbi:vanillate O-demethylase ferredoxin subunit [Hoeflea halophila]|uniref:Vanillate O-demethylase ferredoxin subunit n=1 Tax=Hoeflea halophila TaxID=714899 RepID=A0A286HP34_9HYPH|nr:vanillate O-demethylase ferredoxin subunit [Hoeflea halophila]
MVEPVKLKVASARMLTQSICELEFVRSDGGTLASYTPGAHVKFALPAGERSYSLIDFEPIPDGAAPVSYRFAVQLEAKSSGGSSFMHGLKPGDEVAATAPDNDFPLLADKPALLIAGGIGITPMISMASALQDAGTPFRFHYACRTAAAMAYRDELGERFNDFLTMHFDDVPETALDIAALAGSVGSDEHVYVCGPKGMIDAVKSAMEAAGITQDRIHFELFTSAAELAGDRVFEVEVHATGEVFEIPPGKTIVEVLEAGGVDLMHDCLRGDCGICRTDVIDGIPDHRDVVLSDSEKAEGNVIQICVSRAKSARLVLDL